MGKCPKGLSLRDAEALLQRAVPWSPKNRRKSHPKRLYAVHEGVVYRAVETNQAAPTTASPSTPATFPNRLGARELREALLQQARELGCEVDVRRRMGW